jgi:MFS family permease
MVAQSFLYNSVFFTFGLIIANFHHASNEQVGRYLFPLAIGNFCGPRLLGSLFDTVGRKKMIAGTFAVSGVLLLVTASMFGAGLLSAYHSTDRLVHNILFASARRQFRLPHSKRNISPRNACWPLPASTRSAPPSAAALRPCCSAG